MTTLILVSLAVGGLNFLAAVAAVSYAADKKIAADDAERRNACMQVQVAAMRRQLAATVIERADQGRTR